MVIKNAQEVIEVVRDELPVLTSNALSIPQPCLPPFAYNPNFQFPFMAPSYGHPFPPFVEAYAAPQIVYRPQLEYFPGLPFYGAPEEILLDYNNGLMHPAFGPQLPLPPLSYPIPNPMPPFTAGQSNPYVATAVQFPSPDQPLLQVGATVMLTAPREYEKENDVTRGV